MSEEQRNINIDPQAAIIKLQQQFTALINQAVTLMVAMNEEIKKLRNGNGE